MRNARVVEITTSGADNAVFVSGAVVAKAKAGAVTRVDVRSDACSVIRVTVGRGYSGSVYVNCPRAPT